MGLRESLQSKPWIAPLILLVGLGAAGYAIYSQMSSGSSSVAKGAFYSDDDGASYFTDAPSLIPPFDHNGKQAVKAMVFNCSGEKKVGYLVRYTPSAKAAIDKYLEDVKSKPTSPPASMGPYNAAIVGGMEYKQVGAAKWTPGRLPPTANIKCPDGKPGEIVPVQ